MKKSRKPQQKDIKSTDPLYPVLQNKGALRAEYRKRQTPDMFLRVHLADEQEYVNQGWEPVRKKKKSVRMKRPKSHDVALEDRTWCLFYRMGYPELGGKGFTIKFKRADGSVGEKQIDVFAKDDETVAVCECKSREARGRRSLQKDLGESDSLKGPISKAIRQFYGESFKPKILWFYFTHNIIWSDQDLERAAASNIRVATENEFNYSSTILMRSLDIWDQPGVFSSWQNSLPDKRFPECRMCEFRRPEASSASTPSTRLLLLLEIFSESLL